LSTLPLPDSQFATTASPSSAAATTAPSTRRTCRDELILTNYFTVRDGKIVSLIVIFNTPASY
jgi:hypothetical protein